MQNAVNSWSVTFFSNLICFTGEGLDRQTFCATANIRYNSKLFIALLLRVASRWRHL